MKNLFKLFVMLFAVVAFAACNSTTQEAPVEEVTTEEVAPAVEETPAPVETPADTTAVEAAPAQ